MISKKEKNNKEKKEKNYYYNPIIIFTVLVIFIILIINIKAIIMIVDINMNEKRNNNPQQDENYTDALPDSYLSDLITDANNTNNENNTNYPKYKLIKHNNSWYVPESNINWIIDLSKNIDTSLSARVCIVDLYDAYEEDTTQLNERAINVMCKFNAGINEIIKTKESETSINKFITNTEFEDSNYYYIDINQRENLKPYYLEIIKLTKQKKCTGVLVDGLDSYLKTTSDNINYEQQLEFNIWLSNLFHNNNLTIGMSENLDQSKDLAEHFDFLFVENLFKRDKVQDALHFVQLNKAVLNIENLEIPDFCETSNEHDINSKSRSEKFNGQLISCR
jgi:hypothetical protein